MVSFLARYFWPIRKVSDLQWKHFHQLQRHPHQTWDVEKQGTRYIAVPCYRAEFVTRALKSSRQCQLPALLWLAHAHNTLHQSLSCHLQNHYKSLISPGQIRSYSHEIQRVLRCEAFVVERPTGQERPAPEISKFSKHPSTAHSGKMHGVKVTKPQHHTL